MMKAKLWSAWVCFCLTLAALGQEGQPCGGPNENGGGSSSGKTIQSVDPNEIVGPMGVGEPRFVKAGDWMDYTIYFENKKAATAAAQEVYVTLPKDDGLDWSTFELGEVVIGDQVELGLSSKGGGEMSFRLAGRSDNVKVQVSVFATEIKWYLRSWDNSTVDHFPAEAEDGFLPPNDETHRGEGHLTYRVKVREDAPSGTRIDASATIVFDQNEPIETDPAWWNTVGSLGGTGAFAESELSVDEGGMLKIAVNGGRMDLASRAQVQVAYNTAAAADFDLKNATVNGEKPKSFKFPVTLDWSAGEIGVKTIEIPVVVDKAVEADEFLTLELVNPMNLKIEGAACTVTIRDPGYDALKAKVADGTATKAELDALAKADKTYAGKAYVRGLANDTTRGKVTGSALAADGKTVTLKAAANKGWVFAGWYTDAVCSAGHELAGYGDYRDPSLKYAQTNGAETVYARFITPDEDGLSLGADFLPAAFVVGENVSIEVPVESVSLPTVTIAGLPAGLKYYAKEPFGIYGTVTAKPSAKPLVVTVTVKNLGGYQIVRKYEVSVLAAAPEPSPAPVVSDAAAFHSISVTRSDDFAGTVAGAGVYQAGKKVTLKATPAKGYVFSGWYDGEGAVATQVANWSFEMPDADLALEACFVTAEEDKASVTVGVNGMALLLADGQETASPLSTNVMCGVALQWPLKVESLALPTVAVSGLPAGLKFTAKDVVDSKTKEVLVPANTIYGTPTAASKTDKNGTVVPSSVKVQLTTAGKYKLLFPMEIVVDPLPDWAVGTFNGSEGGLLTLTVAANGKISGKLSKDGLAWTLAAPAFGTYESATETYAAEVTATAGKASKTWPLTLVGETAGETVYGLADLNGDMAYQNLWKLEPWKSEGKLWAARPPAVFTSEDEVGLLPGESVTLKFAASGAVSAAGVFANGYKATCSTVLIPYAESPVAFVYFPPNEKKGFRGYSACLAIGGE